MPEQQIVPANGNQGTEADPSDAPDTQLDQSSSSSRKPRRTNFDWKSAFGSSGGYTFSKRVLKIPESKMIPAPSPKITPAEATPTEAEATPESDAMTVATAEPTEELEQPPVAQAKQPAGETAKTIAEPKMLMPSPAEIVEETKPSFEQTDAIPERVRDSALEGGGAVTGMAPLAVRVCPYLGLRTDRASHFLEASPSHVCYSPAAAGSVSVDYQREFCFTAQYPTCARFPKTGEAKLAAAVALPMAAGLGATSVGSSSLHDTSIPAPVLPPAEVGRAGRSRVLDFLLWGLAIVLAAFALYTALPILLRNASFTGQAPGTATNVAVISAKSPTVVSTGTPESTTAPTAVPVSTLAPLVIPTPSDKEVVLNLLPETRLTGWVASNEQLPHWGDRNLHAGTRQNHAYASVMLFNFNNLPADSRLSFAVLELTGINAEHLGNTGEWKLELLAHRSNQEWQQATTNDIFGASTVTTMGQPLTASLLGVGKINRFAFNDAQLKAIEDQFKYGYIAFRLTGPKSDDDNLFTWDSGSNSQVNAPALHVVIQPGTYTVIVNTPTPANVLTAAAYIFRQTAIAKQFGQPTPLPPGVVTATPGGQVVLVPAETAVPGNQGTAAARSALATAVAITTGTYTPTSVREVVIFPTPTPFLINVNQLPTPTPRSPANFANVRKSDDYLALLGRIIALSTFRSGKDAKPAVLNTDGEVLGQLATDLYYKAALDREPYSPDFSKKAWYAFDDQGIQQVAILDLVAQTITPLTHFQKGQAFDAVWSPDDSAIAFVYSASPRIGEDIWIYDFGINGVIQLTHSEGFGFPNNQHPSWSPDGQNIVYWSSRAGHPQIWIVSRSGGEPIDISACTTCQSPHGDATETNPVWVK